MDRKQLVAAFFDAWRSGDADQVAEWFTDDGVCHNVPMERVEGREAIRTMVAGWIGALQGIDFDFRHVVVEGDVALMERHDVIPRPTGPVRVPLMGVIEFRGDKIAEWREYFDLAQMGAMLEATES